MLKDKFPILAAVVLLDTRVSEGQNLTKFFRQLEKSFITQALEQTCQNRTLAAELLGINRTTLVEKMRSHGFKLNKPC